MEPTNNFLSEYNDIEKKYKQKLNIYCCKILFDEKNKEQPMVKRKNG